MPSCFGNKTSHHGQKLWLGMLALSIAGLGLTACASDRPLETRCSRLADFQLPKPATRSRGPSGGADFSDAFLQAFVPTRGPAIVPQPDALILSGGGEWGAYGAGFMRRWPHARARITTGISTGALQSTYAYLAPDYDASLEGLYETPTNGLVHDHGSLFFLGHASTADQSPLKALIISQLTADNDALLNRVAAEYSVTQRQLFVGSVDGLTGEFHMFDMARMANELQGNERVNCYTAALLASAAVPVVFRQVTISNRPWLDGGVRYAMFVPTMVRSVARARSKGRNLVGSGEIYVVKNGPIETDRVDELPPKLLPTISRLRTVVFNQLDVNSLDLATVYAQSDGEKVYYTTADGWRDFPACRNITKKDEGQLFNENMRRCLLAYGRSKWDSGSSPWLERHVPLALAKTTAGGATHSTGN